MGFFGHEVQGQKYNNTAYSTLIVSEPAEARVKYGHTFLDQ